MKKTKRKAQSRRIKKTQRKAQSRRMKETQRKALEAFDKENIGLNKGSLSFVATITRQLKDVEFPINADDFRTAQEGQVKGLGGGAIKKVLKDHGITRELSSEGGRTSRGNMGRLRAYAEVLNALHSQGVLDLNDAEDFWIERINHFFDSKPFTFRLDPSKSLRFCVRQLLEQAVARQREATGTMYAGTVMQHLVGAKVDLIAGRASLKVEHHGAAVADSPTGRAGDFLIGEAAIHVTTAPSDALLHKISRNLSSGLRPIIVTTADGVGGALAIAKAAAIEDRIDVIEIEQFLATNFYEWGTFEREKRSESVKDLVSRYNEIVAACESDPSLRIEFDE
jgi:hypothetical protein